MTEEKANGTTSDDTPCGDCLPLPEWAETRERGEIITAKQCLDYLASIPED